MLVAIGASSSMRVRSHSFPKRSLYFHQGANGGNGKGKGKEEGIIR